MSNKKTKICNEVYLKIYDMKKFDTKTIACNHPFFIGEVIVTEDQFSITIKKPDMSYMGATSKATIRKYYNETTVMGFNIPSGKYKLDESETNEDQLVVYYR
jgi:hypothetical protein